MQRRGGLAVQMFASATVAVAPPEPEGVVPRRRSRASVSLAQPNLEVACKWLRMTEEGSSHQMTVDENVGNNLLRPLGPSALNLVTIFGQARKGKSFLLNKLASRTSLFPVQASNLPCTVGVDISPHFVELDAFCPCNNEEDVFQSPFFRERTLVGFLDAEGQGDQGIEYDVHLVAPLLLVSKVLIYNWSGRPARDDILQKLSCLAEAAKRVDAEQSDAPGEKLFGHLHLVLRDNPDVEGVHEHVFALEAEKRNCVDALLQRNRIRKILSDSFESISVWGFPSPVKDANVLNRGEFDTRDVTSEFDALVTELRQAIRQQTKGTKGFNGSPLSGPIIASLMPEIAQALNEGVDLLPRSLYEQSEQRQAGLAKQACVEEFEEFVAALRRDMPINQDDLGSQLAEQQRKAMADLRAETGELSTKIRERVEEELMGYMGKETSTCVSENEKRILTKVRRVSEMVLTRFREIFEVPQRTGDEPVDRQELLADYNFRSTRALDLFDSEMEGFADVAPVVRERNDVVKVMEGVRESVVSFNEARIERNRAETERRRAEEERSKREAAENRLSVVEARLQEMEEVIQRARDGEFKAMERAERAERLMNLAQAVAEEEKARVAEIERNAEQQRRVSEVKHEKELARATVLAQRELIKPCCPVA